MNCGTTKVSGKLVGIKVKTPVAKVEKPFFNRVALSDMSQHNFFGFYFNVPKTTFDNVELLGQDTDSLIVQLSDKGNIVHKM